MAQIKTRFTFTEDRHGVFEYSLGVEAFSAEGISPKIFVFHQSPAGIDGNTIAEFDHVATPVDMHELPEDAATETVPWYRTDKCTIWLRSQDDVDTAEQLFVDDIAALQRSYDALSGNGGLTKQTTLEFSNEGVKNVG